MIETRDLVGYGGKPPHPRWPGNARVAVSFVLNFEEGAEFSIADGDDRNEAVYEVIDRLPENSRPLHPFTLRLRHPRRLVAHP